MAQMFILPTSRDVSSGNETDLLMLANYVYMSDKSKSVEDAITALQGYFDSNGSAKTALKFATARNINGMSFDGSANRVNYGTCYTAAATAAKTVNCTGFALVTGAEITVNFTVTNTASNPTLNVNGTGAKSIYYRGSAITADYLAANRTYTFRYNGTQYDLVGDINTTTDTKVTNTLNTTTKAYVTGTTNASTNTGTQVFDTGVYLGTTAGELVASKFTGGLNGNANTATKLATGRSIKINLASTSAATFDGSGDITPGVSETLPLANGGTGKTTAKDAANAFINSLDTGTAAPEDADYFVSQSVGGGTTTTTYIRRPISALWEYIKNKIGSVLGLSNTSYGGNAASATKLATARAIDGVNFNGTAAIIHYGTCSTAAATAAKVVSCSNFTLVTGARIIVKFTVTNTASNPTLNVNGTGAKNIYYRGSTITAGYLAANRVYEFVYDGTQYNLVGDINTDTDTKVTNTLNKTAKAYITGTTNAATNTGTQVFDTGVYLGTVAGRLHVTSLQIGSGILSWDSSSNSIVVDIASS